MAQSFTKQEWEIIFEQLVGRGKQYDLPERSENSIVFGSWNIRKFGSFFDGLEPKRSEGSTKLIQTFCERCDLIAIQEVLTDLSSVRKLQESLNANPARDYRFISSDLTGAVPGGKGLKERMVFLYDQKRISLGDVVSDLNIDQTQVLKNVNDTLLDNHKNYTRDSRVAATAGWFGGKWLASALFVKGKLGRFITFIRSPYLATFKVHGRDGSFYNLSVVNTHLLFGKAKEREREFFYLLEWLLKSTNSPKQMEPPVTLLMADLNLDFSSSNDKRRAAVSKTVADHNSKRRRGPELRVNFPFLDKHPSKGELKTNARQKETFDHIAIFSRGDNRFPWARYNKTAGEKESDGYDFGMFNFVELFKEAGPGLIEGKLVFSKFEHDLSDHMPIYLRLPIPNFNQPIYSENGVS